MKNSVTQKHNFGCGAACVAFVLGISYQDSVGLLGEDKAKNRGYTANEIAAALSSQGPAYVRKYLKPKLQKDIYQDGVIVFIRRSKRYPYGHYLVRHKDTWMDPWIKPTKNNDIRNVESGFRKKLPGKPIYAIFPAQQSPA